MNNARETFTPATHLMNTLLRLALLLPLITLLNSCATMELIQRTKNPLDILALPTEVLSGAVATLSGSPNDAISSKHTRLIYALDGKDYKQAERLLNDGANANGTHFSSRKILVAHYERKGDSQAVAALLRHGGSREHHSAEVSKMASEKREAEENARQAAIRREQSQRAYAERKRIEKENASKYCKWCNAPSPRFKSTPWAFLGGGDIGSYGYFCSRKCYSEWENSIRR